VDIYRGTSASFGSASFIANVEDGVQAYISTGLTAGTTYYWWVLGRTVAGVSNEVGPASATTFGEAGNPGTNIVEQIVGSMLSRCTSLLPADWKALKYPRTPEKADKVGRDRGFGVVPRGSAPGEPAVFGSYTQTQVFEVVLSKGLRPGKGEGQATEAEALLYTWADRLIRDFKGTRLYEDVVLRIGDPSMEAPEYLEDGELAVLRIAFPVTYRSPLT
jgi:hypothetical protein